jgi:hypothetical protein
MVRHLNIVTGSNLQPACRQDTELFHCTILTIKQKEALASIIYLPWVLCLSVCDSVCVCVTICVGTLCYSFSFNNQTDQGDEREGLKREGLKMER